MEQSIDELVSQIRDAEAGYQPNEAVKAHLKSVVMVALIGPFAVGKTSIMQAAAQYDPEQYGYVRGFTTREQRSIEDAEAYDFFPHDAPTLQRLLDEIITGELVQFTVHPTTDRVYGTRVSAYKTPFALLDTLPQAVVELQKLPFKAIRKVAVVTPPKEWAKRFEEREQIEPLIDTSQRLQEGIENLQWLLHNQNELIWINNGGRNIERTTDELLTILTGQEGIVANDEKSIQVATKLLTYMQSIKL